MASPSGASLHGRTRFSDFQFSDFETGDSVRVIHSTKDDEGDDGYVIGLHGKEKGEAALTWNFNSDEDMLNLRD